MKKILLTALAIMLFALPADAANPLLSPLEVNPELEPHLKQLSDGRMYIEIDDMKILVDAGTKAGSQYTKWTSGVVYYQFDASVDSSDGRPYSGDGAARRAAWHAAAMEWEATVPGLTFVEGVGSGNYIRVVSNDYNNSWVGMIGGPQDVNLYNWNYRFIIAHEIGHALSLLHEQSRSDRDTYVTVHYGNIQDAYESQYHKSPGVTNHGIYDYESVMHYGRCHFADGGWDCGPNWTMDATVGGAAAAGMSQSEANDAMGNRSDLSDGDIDAMRTIYPGSGGLVFSSCLENGRTRGWSYVEGDGAPSKHSLCIPGDAVDPTHDTCVDRICAYDSYCCDSKWDSACIAHAISICGENCD